MESGKLRILYIGYWGANEGISQATINPNLKILLTFPEVEKLLYSSIERNKQNTFSIPSDEKLKHLPLKADKYPFRIINKLIELILFGNQLLKITKEERINLIICRSSLSGNWGLKIHKSTGIPFVVESFEPHSDYMLELGIWKKWGPSFLFQKRSETEQKKRALRLYPVAENYRIELMKDGINSEKVKTIPCGVDLIKFAYSKADRIRIRSKLQINQDTPVGIYVGKFGGIYMDDDAFRVFANIFSGIPKFYLIILTPENNEYIRSRCLKYKLPSDRVTVLSVPHMDVPNYLSAADIALSLIKSTPLRRFCSPIKHGEYWANGLPIIVPDGIGDDSNLIEGDGGIVFNQKENLKGHELDRIIFLIEKFKKNRNDNVSTALARNYRNINAIKSDYSILLETVSYYRKRLTS